MAAFACLLILANPAAAQERPAAAFETIAKQAVLYDYDTRSVLFSHNGDQKIAPASLVKLMNVAIVFRELREGRLKLDGDMIVSTDAWRRGGAVSGGPNMLLTPNKVLKVGELLNGLIVGAANDAALVLAENIAGTEARFVAIMNEHARDLGLSSVTFRNATGFAAEGQEGSLMDFVRLGVHVITTYPDFYALFAQKDMALGRNRQVSRNPLLAMDIGADGLMTGSVPEEGHLILGSAIQGGRRLVVALAGVETVQERAIEARKLFEWGFRRFEARTLFVAGARVGEVSVYGGASGMVAVRTEAEIRLPVLRGSGEGATLRLAYRGPVPAPIAEGATIARLEVMIDGRIVQAAPLVAAEAVPAGSVAGRAQDAALELTRQWANNGFRWLIDKAGLSSKPKPDHSQPLPPADATGALDAPGTTSKSGKSP